MVSDSESTDYIVRAKGFSFEAQASDLSVFFAGCDIKGGKNKGIHFLYNGRGKSRAEVYVEFREEEDFKRALQQHKKYLGERYVDVLRATREDMELALAQNNVGGNDGESESTPVVKVSGMPFNAQHDDVATFFAGADIAGGKKNGILFMRNEDGSASGSCYVEFLTSDDMQLALSKDKAYMGQRFCHVSKSSVDERDLAQTRQNECLQDLAEPIIKLRGLPFKTSNSDIQNLFKDLDISIVEMVLNDQGNCKGEAFLEFGSMDDAKEAIKYYKMKHLHRYIDVIKSNKCEWLKIIPETTKVTKSIEDIEEPIVRLGGLPVKVTKDQIEDFFFGLDVRAIQIVRLPRGACNGEAFVEFQDIEQTVKALSKHKSHMTSGESEKLIEVVSSSRCDWRKEPLKKAAEPAKVQKSDSQASRKRPLALDHATSQERGYQQPRMTAPLGYPGAGGTYANVYAGYQQHPQIGYADSHPTILKEYLVNMVGLPFSATEEDVRQFFYPTKMTAVEFLLNERNQPRGIAVVGFYSEEERAEAMKKNKNSIGSRYVNLYIRHEGRDYPFDFSKGGKKDNRDSYGRQSSGYSNSRSYDSRSYR